MSKIFISHSGKNNAEALALCRWLQDNGWGDSFLDIIPDQGLVPGERWPKELKDAVERCEAGLFLISIPWCNSVECRAEFLFANRSGKTIFAVLIEDVPIDTLPKEMTAEWQLCDLVHGDQQTLSEITDDLGRTTNMEPQWRRWANSF